MRTTRRGFLGAVGAAVFGGWAVAPAGIAAPAGFAAPRRPRLPTPIGLQLYTVRDLLSEDFDGTLERVAAIGYREVELAGRFGRTPAQVRAALAAAGLDAPSTHVPYDTTGDAWEATLAEAAEAGHRFVTVPWIPQEARRTLDGWKGVAERFNRAGERARRAGLRFAYHNHDFELAPVDGVVPIDVLIAETDPSVVDFQMDVYWMFRGGRDPLRELAAHPDRYRMLHLKDSAGPPDHDMVDVGDGVIDFAALLAEARRAGVLHAFVEHDQPADPIASVEASYAHLAGLEVP